MEGPRVHPRLRTGFCRELGISLPIVQAPMAGGWTTPEMVAAVSEAGAIGFLPAAMTTVSDFGASVARVRSLTTRPFGVNFLLAPPEAEPGDVDAVQRALDPLRDELGLPPGPRALPQAEFGVRDHLRLALEERVPVVSFAMGHPGSLAEEARAADARVLVMVTSVEEALEAEAAGADAVIAQGAEAGGHRSTFRVGSDAAFPRVGTFVLVPRVADAVSVPVVAAGGIVDGRGIVAALALGASAAQLGTRFLLATESGAFPAYRERIARGADTSTRITRLLTGRPARALGNAILERLESSGVPPLSWPYQALAIQDIYRHAMERGSADTMALLAGQAIVPGSREMSAAEIVRALAGDATRILEGLGARG